MTRTTRVAIVLLEAIDFAVSPERWSLRAVIGLLAVLIAIIGVYDAYLIATGTVDLNRHWPILVPAVMAAFIVIIRAIDRAGSNPA